ncbi:DOPA 4,5-dioxygenase family protein [Marinomonas sp. C2222]|uniref:DOPA 4,5-dioxygenase family protein n=1 Tax=Marinomonas sargassi TaxID=2984494 RepID=A0ABT2YUQ1_9GAMM|nr:DOPA 4,5-dioxygenase family protein [Marinomonas sargassi]MCV2403617.1 DOPA 4,5-dioxygenase family protein [Marinomonas sargassi]
MLDTLNIQNTFERYHAHVYFNEETKLIAKQLCERSEQEFGLKIGRFHEKLVGPHPMWSCQISVDAKDFDTFIPWIEENRQGLTIFIHAISGDNMRDHTELTTWLGKEVELDLDFFVRLAKERAAEKL